MLFDTASCVIPSDSDTDDEDIPDYGSDAWSDSEFDYAGPVIEK